MVGKVEQAVAAQAKALSDAADKILAVPAIEPERFQSLSTAEAVLRYAGDFVPSWAGAISIDLMPAVLVLIFCVVHANIRREDDPVADASTITAADMLTALRLAREMRGRRAPSQKHAAVVPETEAPLAPFGRERHAAFERARGKKD